MSFGSLKNLETVSTDISMSDFYDEVKSLTEQDLEPAELINKIYNCIAKTGEENVDVQKDLELLKMQGKLDEKTFGEIIVNLPENKN